MRSQPVLAAVLSLADAGYDEWLDQVGSTFSVGGSTAMKLVAVTALNLRTARGRTASPRQRLRRHVRSVQAARTMAGDLIYTAIHSDLWRVARSSCRRRAIRDPPQRMIAVFN